MKDTTKLLQDMLDAITSIESYAVSSYSAFLDDEKTQDAIMFNLIVMGEAANKISDEFLRKTSGNPGVFNYWDKKRNRTWIRPGQITDCMGYHP